MWHTFLFSIRQSWTGVSERFGSVQMKGLVLFFTCKASNRSTFNAKDSCFPWKSSSISVVLIFQTFSVLLKYDSGCINSWIWQVNAVKDSSCDRQLLLWVHDCCHPAGGAVVSRMCRVWWRSSTMTYCLYCTWIWSRRLNCFFCFMIVFFFFNLKTVLIVKGFSNSVIALCKDAVFRSSYFFQNKEHLSSLVCARLQHARWERIKK